MRRTAATAATALVATMVLGTPALAAEHPVHQRAAGTACVLGVVGFDVNRHVRTYLVKDGRVTRDQLSSNALGFDVTAWGFFDSKSQSGDRRTLRLNAMTTNGTPHNVAIKQSKKKVSFESSPSYDGKLRPRLFADGGTFYAYTVDGNTLKRYGLYRFADGSRRFDQPVTVVKGFRDWTSLQAGSFGKVDGRTSEVLYGTTAKGELMQVAVPFDRPGKAKVRRLEKSGYEGVSEISWGRCGKNYDQDVLVTISPTTNSATWTTIKRPTSKPKAKPRAAVTGGLDWNFSAAF